MYIIPTVGEVWMLEKITSEVLTLKLYGNDKAFLKEDQAFQYLEVAGGGYSSKELLVANWDMVSGYYTEIDEEQVYLPSEAMYNELQEFNFTGPLDFSSPIYGYFIVNSGGILVAAERFTPANGVTPVNGSIIRLQPRIRLISPIS